jgi:hypothetical protein
MGDRLQTLPLFGVSEVADRQLHTATPVEERDDLLVRHH